MWNMERIRLTASEEMSFENVDGRTDDERWMPVYTISSPVSLRLRWANKKNYNMILSIYHVIKMDVLQFWQTYFWQNAIETEGQGFL